VRSEILPGDAALARVRAAAPGAVVLSGGPNSVAAAGAPAAPFGLWEWARSARVPLLGVCYGMQLMVNELGGSVRCGHADGEGGEYGRMPICTEPGSALYGRGGGEGVLSDKDANSQEGPRGGGKEEEEEEAAAGDRQLVWMSHGDEAERLPVGFQCVARSDQGAVVAIENSADNFYGLQYHPEVRHSERGAETLGRFFFEIAGLKPTWQMEGVLQEQLDALVAQVGPEEHAICALSGGVDSTVAASLVHKALGDRLHCVFVDNGLLRFRERERVEKMFKDELSLDVTVVDASERMLGALRGVSDPEAKRKKIGALFIDVFRDFREELAKRLGKTPKFLVQGTLYPDVIESCPPPGSDQKHSHTIKSHHNVGGLPEDLDFELVEPLRWLFKDEVRRMGALPELGVPASFLQRHPFPGPGLAVRVLGDVTVDGALDTLRDVDEIFIQSLREEGLYDKIWQAFAVFLPVKSVGVQGDQRTHSNAVALRAVTSSDGMTADWYDFEPAFLRRVSTKICNKVKGVNRVVYDITSKPPGTIEWE
jgi:GMP synthase (glutamine-hydrolysing)